jgi:ribonuclease M5
MTQNGLAGCGGASEKRADIGALLGIGYGNGKQFLKRLNHFGITRDEWESALTAWERQHDHRIGTD